MNKILLILALNLLADAEVPCITWEMTLNKLDIICRLDNIVLPVSIYDKFRREQAKCEFNEFNDFSAICSSVNKHANITASYSNGEFKLAITKVTRSLVEGEWSCIQGTQTLKTVISQSAGIILSTQVDLTGQISHQNNIKTVVLSCFSCREPHGNIVEFLVNHYSVDNVRYDHDTKRCFHKDGECRPDRCSCSSSGNLFTYSFEYTDNTTKIVFSCGMRFVDKLISTRFSMFSSVIYDGKEFKSNGSETDITKAPEKTDFNHDRSDNDTDNSTISPVKEESNLNGLHRIIIGVAVALLVLLIVVIVYCQLHKKKKGNKEKRGVNREESETAGLTTHLLLEDNEHISLAEQLSDNEQISLAEQLSDNEQISLVYQNEQENIYKLLLFIVNIAYKVIRKVISYRLLTNDETFTSYLKNGNNKHALFHAWHNNKRCCQCKSDDNMQKESMLTKTQFQFMFNNRGSVPQRLVHITDSKIFCLCNIAVNDNVSLEVLDVSVAICLLVSGCTSEMRPELSDKESILDWMKTIKYHRNELCPLISSKHLAYDEFTDKWQKIQEAVIGLAYLVDPFFSNEIDEEIKVLRKEVLEITNSHSEKMTEVFIQSQQDWKLTIDQLCEERFMAKLKEANKVIDSSRPEITSLSNREGNIFTKIGEISINIVEYPYVKVEDYQDRNTLDVLLRVHAPRDWTEDEILETIRQMVKQINSKGNIKIKETTLENFMLIVEMKITTLIEKEPLTNEIEDFFRIICQQCKIDITQPNTIEVSIESLSDKNNDEVISNAIHDPGDDSNVYATSFHINSAIPPQIAIAVEEDVLKDQTDRDKLEVTVKPEIKSKPLDEDRKSAMYNKPDKNRIEESLVSSITSISPPNPVSSESKKKIDSVPPLPPKTDYIQILPSKDISSPDSVDDLPQVRAKSQEPLDGPPPCNDRTVYSEYTDPSLDERPSEVELAFIRSFVVQKGKDAFLTSCAVWSDDNYILIDRNNRLLLMYNHKTGDVQSEDLRNEPWSMVIIDNNNVAISFPERKQMDIYYSNISNKLKFREVIKVEGKCFTLTKKDDETLLVYIDGKGIHSFNMSKKEFKSLDIQIPSFVPHSDEICARNNRLYHTSRFTSSVSCYDMNGSMLWDFNGDLKRPTALTCDKFGNVYVTDYTSHHLYFISADGLSHKTLLSREDKVWHPTFVYYCMKRECLLIVNRDNGYAASYSVKYK